MADESDPTITLDRKIAAFADTLTDDELTVLHDIVHLAYEGGEVQGFAMPHRAVSLSGDPCEGGEVTFPNTFDLIGNLHLSLHRPPPAGPIPASYPNQG